MSLDLTTVTAPILMNQVYIWTQTAVSITIPAFTIASSLSICSSIDVVYTMTVVGSLNGSTTFVKFNSLTMITNWFDNIIRVAETFTIDISAKITNLNAASPFTATKSFTLAVTPPTCEQSLDEPIITPSTISNQVYIWTQTAVSCTIPAFSIASSLSICS